MPTPTYTVTCTEKRRLAPGIYDILFTKPEGFSWQAGQFVLFHIGLIDNPQDVQARAFSVASIPREPELLFNIQIIPGGRASRWFEEVVAPGTVGSMQGPFGNFLLDRTTDKEYLFIATGSGVAPFRPQILDALESGSTRRMDLVFGVRSEEDLFWTDEFSRLKERYPNFSHHLALTHPSDAWTGHRGRVQTLVPKIVSDFSRKSVYVCGSPDMTKELSGLCLNEWLVPKQDLHVEGYI